MFNYAICEDVVRVATFKERFLLLKVEKDVTLGDIAIAIGSNKASISKFVNGSANLKTDTLEAMANFFNVDQAYLLGESDIRRKNYDDIINKAYLGVIRSAKAKDITPEKLKRIIDCL